MEEKHFCYLCGEEANFQLKNGKWCCCQNARSCKAIKAKVSEKAKEKWEELRQKGIKRRENIPLSERKQENFGEEHICFYCGRKADHQLKNKRWCCSENFQSCPANRQKNSNSCKQAVSNGSHSNIEQWNLYRKENNVQPWNKGLTKETDERIRKTSEKIKNKYQTGELVCPSKGTKLSTERKEQLSRIQSERLANPNIGGFTKIGWYSVKNINGTEYTVRGTWEKETAEALNKLGILWIKNVWIPYSKEDGSKHRYNPDFFLPKENLYIEVKGYFSDNDKEKMNLVLKQNNVKIKMFKQDEINLIKKGLLTEKEIFEE